MTRVRHVSPSNRDNAATKYPSVIDGKPYERNSLQQKVRARAVASQIIRQFGLTVENPY
jgi:hypothetical protein